MACDHVDIEAERQERLPKIMAGGRQKARLRIVRPRVVDDCLVAGTGATHEQSWPAVLAQRTGWTVVSAGVPGDTSEAALLETHRPDALIIAVGGNDFLRNVPPDHTRAQLEEMTRLSRSAATRVAIMAVPRVSAAGSMFGTLSDHALFAEFAQARGVVLVPGAIAGGGLSRTALRSDRIHANGYAYMAAQTHEALVRHGRPRCGEARATNAAPFYKRIGMNGRCPCPRPYGKTA